MTLNPLHNTEKWKSDKLNEIGHTVISYIQSVSILTPGKGFMAAYDYTLNPYSGCSFGCGYCYAAFFSPSLVARENWGRWLKVKENALALLIKMRAKPLIGKTVYISSVTDPYQPIEKQLELTRNLLKELLDYHSPRLVIQTRSPLITRDIDILSCFDTIQVNMTVTTDNESVRKTFEPYCASNGSRLRAIKRVTQAEIPTCITMTPLLPIRDVEKFVEGLLETGVEKFIIQPFHSEKRRFVGNTEERVLEQLQKLKWDEGKYLAIVDMLKERLPWLGEGKQGFTPI